MPIHLGCGCQNVIAQQNNVREPGRMSIESSSELRYAPFCPLKNKRGNDLPKSLDPSLLPPYCHSLKCYRPSVNFKIVLLTLRNGFATCVDVRVFICKIFFLHGIPKVLSHAHVRMVGSRDCFRGLAQFARYPGKSLL